MRYDGGSRPDCKQAVYFGGSVYVIVAYGVMGTWMGEYGIMGDSIRAGWRSVQILNPFPTPTLVAKQYL